MPTWPPTLTALPTPGSLLPQDTPPPTGQVWTPPPWALVGLVPPSRVTWAFPISGEAIEYSSLPTGNLAPRKGWSVPFGPRRPGEARITDAIS